MSAWSDFYKARLGPRYLAHVKARYAPFLALLHSHIRPTDTVLEAGCGMGTVTRALLDQGIGRYHLCVDDDPKMLELAWFQAGPSSAVSPVLSDIRSDLLQADIIHGHGVLEHFGDEDIRAIIAAHRRTRARAAIHYVPSDKYEKPSFGDERLMPAARWREIAAPHEIHAFNNGHDLALVWEFGAGEKL